MIVNERQLNYYFNIGKFNHPVEIGYVMSEIRKAKPLTLNEWRFYYYENVRTDKQLREIAIRMYNSIEGSHRKNYSIEVCLNYIEDVIFRRTFEGYNKENQALKILNKLISARVLLSPKEWDGEYFIDFVIENPLIGIQLKPETFYQGGYNNVVDISGKLKEFENNFGAKTFILIYKKLGETIEIKNMDAITEIKKLLGHNN